MTADIQALREFDYDSDRVPTDLEEAIHRVLDRLEQAEKSLARVRELHEPFTWSFGFGPVQSCKWCADHGVSQEVAGWPCPTIRALEGDDA